MMYVAKRRDAEEMKFDMHCHTKEGSVDGKVAIEDVIGILREKGFGGMLVSDHNSYKGYRTWRKNMRGRKYKDFVVLRGVEYDTIDAGHILVILPENVNLKILELRGLPVLLLIDIVHRNGGILGPAHPCGEKYVSITNTGKHRNQLAVMDRFDFVEAFNACETPRSNRRAASIAKLYGKPQFGGSDAHRADCVGMAYTELPDSIRRESDLIAYVKRKEKITCGGSYYKGTTKEKIGKGKYLLMHSFWFYNRLGSLFRGRRRRAEMHKLL